MKRVTSITDISATLLERIPQPPQNMNDVAAGFWKKKCKGLKDCGRLTSIILETLEAYCNVLADMQKARQMMDGAWGTDVFLRYQKAYNESAKMHVVLARELGFTLASHQKTGVPKSGKEKKFEFDLS